jgi:hypothetical protein
MSKKLVKVSLFCLLFVLSAVSLHRFYVGMYQLKFVPEKKMLQITTRIFIDDINETLFKKHHQKTNIGDKTETTQDFSLFQNYIAEKFKISINNQPKKYQFVSREIEGNVIVCYFKITEISKINSLQVENSILTELFDEQQNIIQFDNNGKKQSLLLTSENTKGVLE